MAARYSVTELSTASRSVFNPEYCILCQECTNSTVTSTENGRQKIVEAAAIRKDIVSQWLESAEVKSSFVYHMTNDCYKQYTLKKTLEKLRRNQDNQDIEAPDNVSDEHVEPAHKRTRSSVTPREEPSSAQHAHKQKCVICSQTQQSGIRDKFRICESPRAQKFLQATLHFLDEVYTRIADLEEETRIFGADLYYHKNCLENYLRKYERVICERQPTEKAPKKCQLFLEEIEDIKKVIDHGAGIPLSEIRDLINEKNGENIISNKEVKLFMIQYLGAQVQFCPSEQRNESLLVFSASLSMQDVVKKLRSINTLRNAAKEIRKTLVDLDFGLDDKFCDAEELKSSWNITEIPDELVEFFSTLFNIKKTTLMTSHSAGEEDIQDLEGYTDEVASNAESDNRRVIKMKSLFQMMYYIIHNGRRKTPLHVMTAHHVYDKCKSKELITSLNRTGVCISYNEIQRARSNLAQYAYLSSQAADVPLPSHFSTDTFTIAAFDNFDHADQSSPSGMMSNHDTVMTLFQVKPDQPPTKPPVSSFDIAKLRRNATSKLPCQEIKHFAAQKKNLCLPSSFCVESSSMEYSETRLKENNVEFVYSCLKGLSSTDTDADTDVAIPTWAAFRSLLSSANIPIMQVGFLPYLPYPVTDSATVYTAMNNFLKVLGQLDQTSLPVFCDEGVFRIVVEIVLQHTNEFKNLIPMLGGFHMAKAVQHCIGKFMKASGLEDALVETETFGLKVVESVMAGTHYVRSLRGQLLIAEALQAMKWEAFWQSRNSQQFEASVEAIKDLKRSVNSKNRKACRDDFEKCVSHIPGLKQEYEEFSKACCAVSEMCTYWEELLKIIGFLKDLVAADREGNWEGHLLAVQNLLPVFRECDSINYLRYASYYLEKMRKLPEEHPGIYAQFQRGLFVVKQHDGFFNAVSPDMKLEQTIQRSQKSSSGIIGQTRKVAFVSEWEVVYHEVLAISNAFRDLVMAKVVSRESDLHHESSGNYTKMFNMQAMKLLEFMKARGNPYILEPGTVTKLHNFVTSLSVSPTASVRLLHFYDNGKDNFNTFRKERFVEKSKKLSDTINKVNLPNFASLAKSATTISVNSKLMLKEVAEAQKDVDIARSRGISLTDILEHDLLTENPLFEKDFTKKPDKHVLVNELEKLLDTTDYSFNQSSQLKSGLIIDFMSQIRRLPLRQMSVFIDLLQATWNSVKNVCQYEQVDVVYDSYVQSSIKECERQRRSRCDPLELLSVKDDTKVPVQFDRFWACAKNKEMLQVLSIEYLSNNAMQENINIVLSGYIASTGEIMDCTEIQNKERNVRKDLTSTLEEADLRMIPHIHQASLRGMKRIVVVSNDTDVFALILFYMPRFQSVGLLELWLKFGIGGNTRFIPLHTLSNKIGHTMCSAVLKAHVLTGCDVTSKIGTKPAALKAKPEMYLSLFGEEDRMTESVAELAETYLTKVLQPNTSSRTFNELRVELYHKKTIVDLPPTSRSILGHLQRCHFVCRQCVLLLDGFCQEDPCDNGWINDNGLLLPAKHLLELPGYYLVKCGCKSLAQLCLRNCKCARNDVGCTEHCKCRGLCQK